MQLTLLSNFASNFHAAVDGRGSSPDGIEMNELYGGARIRCVPSRERRDGTAVVLNRFQGHGGKERDVLRLPVSLETVLRFQV